MKATEQRTIDKFIGTAYNMSAYAIKQIERRTSKAAEWIKVIYGESTDEGARKIAEAYKSIVQRIERGLRVRRENVFVNEYGEDVSSVLSGADLENGVVIIYDAFFKKTEGDEKGVNDRASVIMHEIAHLIGLKGDEEQKSYESAECLRNFTLLICDIVKPEDLFIEDEEGNEENAELVGEDGELPYDPNQPRDKIGRWTDTGGNGDADRKDSPKDSGSENSKPRAHKLAPGINAKVGPDGNSIVIGGKITGPNKEDEIEIGNDDGAIRVNPDTGIGVQIHGNGDITIESDKPIDVLKKGIKAGSFRKIKVDKDGNINEKESQIKGRLPFTGGFIVDGLQGALNKNKGKK